MNQDKNVAVQIFGLGGGGTDIVSSLMLESDPTLSHASAVYADTSPANREPWMTEENFFDFGTEAKGSGQVRRKNVGKIAEETPRILQKHPIGETNILVATLGGGTGSTAQPLLAREILNRGKKVILVGVGIEETSNTTLNTFTTLKGFDKFSRDNGIAYPLCYAQCSLETPWKKAVSDAQFLIRSLTWMANPEMRQLDGEDIASFLNFDRVTGYEPSLSLIRIWDKMDTMHEDAKEAFAMIATLTDGDQPMPNLFMDFRKAGFYRTPGAENRWFTNETQGLHDLLKRLQNLEQQIGEKKQAHRAAPKFVTGKEDVDSSGLPV